MPSTKDEPTVFYARDKNPPIDGLDGYAPYSTIPFHISGFSLSCSPVPSIEDENESFEIVVSDIAGVDDGEEKAPTPINPKSFARSVKRIRSAVSSEDESSSKTMETPPKRQRRVYPGAPATPRRSERISSAAASSAPKEEEPPAVKVPAKRGRGRPPDDEEAALSSSLGGWGHNWDHQGGASASWGMNEGYIS
ncbi:hypothetical protein ACJZ2D_006430 [Fusarium nematophilum]